MICSSCRFSLFSRLPRRPNIRPIQLRPASTAPSTTPSPRQPSSAANVPPPDQPDSPKSVPSAISSKSPGISQPLTTPMLPSTAGASKPSSKVSFKPPTKSTKLVGSVPGGTPLQGIGYTKARPVVYAKEDDEYPAWLWTLLDEPTSSTSKDGKNAADLAAMPRAAREKYLKRQEKLLKDLPPKIPVHEQSVDLTQPGDDAAVSLQKRQEITKSSRAARRKGIKEENFLRGM